ncbi:hypothetical protein LTR27_005456 [Elasticomyces elasticus]|nr:hypothetical protein LTR27_005456 [Elasticomyces elasticus]
MSTSGHSRSHRSRRDDRSRSPGGNRVPVYRERQVNVGDIVKKALKDAKEEEEKMEMEKAKNKKQGMCICRGRQTHNDNGWCPAVTKCFKEKDTLKEENVALKAQLATLTAEKDTLVAYKAKVEEAMKDGSVGCVVM